MIAPFLISLALVVPDPAAARNEGDRLIVAAQAADLFQNVTEDGVIRLKHSASGLVCTLNPTAGQNNVRIYPVRPDVPRRGDDVGCGTTEQTAFTVYATRYRQTSSDEAAMAMAVAEIQGFWREVERLDIATPSGIEDGQFAAFRGRHPNGQMLSTVIIVRQMGPWTFKMRASGLPDQGGQIAAEAAERFIAQLPQAR